MNKLEKHQIVFSLQMITVNMMYSSIVIFIFGTISQKRAVGQVNILNLVRI